MKIYVAGASKEIDLCERYIRRLRAAGAHIMHDWTASVRENAGKGRPDDMIPHVERAEYAQADLRGVERAESFWLIAPETNSTGCWTELGFALATGATIYVSGPWRRSIFADLAHVSFDDHESAFVWIKNRIVR